MALRVAAVAAAVAALLVPPAPAAARINQCSTPPPQAQVSRAEPEEVRLYDPRRLAPLATGAGVRVAVIDSGVDAAHPGCAVSTLGFTTQTNGGAGWTVAGHGSLPVTLAGALSMSASAANACQGATFTVYLKVAS